MKFIVFLVLLEIRRQKFFNLFAFPSISVLKIEPNSFDFSVVKPWFYGSLTLDENRPINDLSIQNIYRCDVTKLTLSYLELTLEEFLMISQSVMYLNICNADVEVQNEDNYLFIGDIIEAIPNLIELE